MLAGHLANRGLIDPLYGCCLQCCTGHVCKDVCIKGTQCILSHASNAQRNMWARPAVATIKFKREKNKRSTKKTILKNYKEER